MSDDDANGTTNPTPPKGEFARGLAPERTPFSQQQGLDLGASLRNSPSYPSLIEKIATISAINNQLVTDSMSKSLSAVAGNAFLQSLRSSSPYGAAPDLSGVIAGLSEFSRSWRSLTRSEDYSEPDPPRGAYSPEMQSPASYFMPKEVRIESFDDLHKQITRLIGRNPGLPLVWRGVRRSDWGLHSHLYRHLMNVNKVISPQKRPKREQFYPDENQMVQAEREILRISREDWRFDNMSALETFARIQHAGGPTRLIDVTLNPYVAAWFAVEHSIDEESHDSRLFAIATRPVPKTGEYPVDDSTIQLDEVGALRDPFWHLLKTPADRQALDWGTGARRRLWTPPAYDPRISAQNAAFIVDGVPITSSRTAPYFAYDRNRYWRRADLLASSSIYAKMHDPGRKAQYNSRNFAPTFSFRIPASKKAEIREYLESRFGYRRSYIFPDMSALAAHLTQLPLARQ